MFIDKSKATDPCYDILEKALKAVDGTTAKTESEFRQAINNTITKMMESTMAHYELFKEFIQKMAHEDKTSRVWVQFVFVDAMAYVSLFLAIRSGDWHLRMVSIKNMAPIFTAFDHSISQKLISNHISDLLHLPKSILTMLQQGVFVVSITGREWHSVAIDEAHEMLINKQCKTSIVKPSFDYVNRIATYLTYRTRVLQCFKHQLFRKSKETVNKLQTMYSSTHNDKMFEINVKAILDAVVRVSMLNAEGTNRGLTNPFTNDRALDQ